MRRAQGPRVAREFLLNSQSCAFATYTPQCLVYCSSAIPRPVHWPIGRPACRSLSQAFRSIRRSWQSLNQDGLALKSGNLEMLHGVPEASPN
jgi:hypothetical protein